jgi:hypothetical protein
MPDLDAGSAGSVDAVTAAAANHPVSLMKRLHL